MSESQNVQIVKEAYAAFGRRDIPALLAVADEHIDWQPVLGAEGFPNAGHRHGREAVGEFFKITYDALEFQRFEPREFVAQGDTVVVLGHYTGRVKATGGKIDTDWAMVFTLSGGKITKFVEFSDSLQLVRAAGLLATT